MRSRLSAVVARLCVLVVAAPSLGAQSPAGDTLPIRRGQWAIEFPVQATYSLGLLNFLGRHTALVLDGSAHVAGENREVLYAGTSGARQRLETDDHTMTLKIGLRRYHQVAPKAAGFYQFGVSPSYVYERYRYIYPDGYRNESMRSTYSVGAFFGVGGTYFITPRVTAGMITNTQLAYRRHSDRNKSTSPVSQSESKASGRGFAFSVTSPMIVAALYF